VVFVLVIKKVNYKKAEGPSHDRMVVGFKTTYAISAYHH